MDKKTSEMTTLSLASLFFVALPASAVTNNEGAKSEVPAFSIELSAGVEYDSNVSVDEIDNNTSKGDSAAVFYADLGYEKELTKNTKLDLNYSFSQNFYDEFTEFDMQTHFASADLSHDFDGLVAGGAYRYIYTTLDREGFLTLQQFSPYVTRFLSKKLFVRADYTYTDKEFEDITTRNATTDAIGANFYYFLNGAKRYFVIGYTYKDEDAKDPQFDYDSHQFKLSFLQRFKINDRKATFKMGWHYEPRDYTSATPSIGKDRGDDRNTYEVELEVQLTDAVFVLLEYEYADFSSNLSTADYTQNFSGVRIGYRH